MELNTIQKNKKSWSDHNFPKLPLNCQCVGDPLYEPAVTFRNETTNTNSNNTNVQHITWTYWKGNLFQISDLTILIKFALLKSLLRNRVKWQMHRGKKDWLSYTVYWKYKMPQLQYPILKMLDGMVHKTLTAFNTSHGTNLKKYQ
jgi:hypothetical protein